MLSRYHHYFNKHLYFISSFVGDVKKLLRELEVMNSVIAQLAPEGNFASYISKMELISLYFVKLHIVKNLQAIHCELSL